MPKKNETKEPFYVNCTVKKIYYKKSEVGERFSFSMYIFLYFSNPRRDVYILSEGRLCMCFEFYLNF